ncbi:MAG: hypothetical protein M1825_006531 [Sarcosagium campestre]|nr:MAG: hypothetical protein M1825_006531 [Sarcosagium campestre]
MPIQLISSLRCFEHALSRSRVLPAVGPHFSAAAAAASFHTSSIRLADSTNHYETLNLPTTATASEVKKQFYALSKTHHPDRNPSDPTASARFVQISEAYAVLGSPQKRERYDRDIFRRTTNSPPMYRGSHASTTPTGSPGTGPAGGRPASGLSRRRTQFRGPPPSFYRSGGWGAHAEKRSKEQAGSGRGGESAGATSGFGRDSGPAAYADSPSWPQNSRYARAGMGADGGGRGFGPGDTQSGFDYDVPHFDRDAHFRTQEQQDYRRRRRRAAAQRGAGFRGGGGSSSSGSSSGSGSGGNGDEEGQPSSTLFDFLVVTGIVLIGVSVPTFMVGTAFSGNVDHKPARSKRRDIS